MKYNPEIHKRKSVRLKNYDYSSEWLYFITIASQNKLCLFWSINNWELNLFESWKMIQNEWLNLENKYNNIKLHNFVIMPNHFHWIIEIRNIVGAIPRGCPDEFQNSYRVPTRGTPTGNEYNYENQIVGAIPRGCPYDCKNGCPDNFGNRKTIWNIIWWFKSITTNEYIKNVKNKNRVWFNKKLWQTNYYEHIIRNEESFTKICEYIENNPLKWDEDKFYNTEILIRK